MNRLRYSCVYLTEGLDVSQVPLRPRGRPSGRFFLSMMGAGQEQATDLSMNSQINNNNHSATDLTLASDDMATDLTTSNSNQQDTDQASEGNMSTPDLQVQ